MKTTDHFDRLPESVKKTVYEKSHTGAGLPDALKTGVEKLSGMDVSDVRVHYNSLKPVQANAESYALGNDIHIAPGQEKHLAHETWHVVQQKQGRVKPTAQAGSIAIGDDASLQREANVMGAKALHLGAK
jgi:hypothetical protein